LSVLGVLGGSYTKSQSRGEHAQPERRSWYRWQPDKPKRRLRRRALAPSKKSNVNTQKKPKKGEPLPRAALGHTAQQHPKKTPTLLARASTEEPIAQRCAKKTLEKPKKEGKNESTI